MSINFSNSLVGLSMLTGDNSLFGLASSMRFETRAVRIAKAQFTTPQVTAPWQQPGPNTPLSAQLAAIKRLSTIIDKTPTRDASLPADVQTSFVAYKALEQLRVLAESASAKTASSAMRLSLDAIFAKGLGDLQDFLAAAPTDKVKLAFDKPSRRAESVAMAPTTAPTKTLAVGILDARNAAIPGIAGNEILSVSLSKYGVTESVTVDLSTVTQPPTFDGIATALNAAIASVPMRDTNGAIVLDGNGDPVAKYSSHFSVEKNDGKWGLALNALGVEKVGIDQVGAKDSLIVASGQTALDAPTTTKITRFDDPAGAVTQKTLRTIAAIDRDATAVAALNPPKPAVNGATAPEPQTIWATTTARAIATDAQGNSYVVGTTAGDLGSNRVDGAEDLFLTKLDSEGRVQWQRTLGASGGAQGAAVSIAANGDIVVAGTVSGPFNGSLGADSDMLVVKFDANGDEKFATSVRALGNEEANAVAVGADGTIYLGGRSGTGGGDAFLARISATGALQERRTINSGGSDSVTALAIDGSGELLALTKENGTATLRRIDAQSLTGDLGSLALGSADARAIAVSATGEIAVVGATLGALSGTQVNSTSGGRDGFVARIDAGLSGASVSYLGSADDDQADSVTFMTGALYVGGRTTGAMDGARRGAVDGFISRIDTATGAIQSTTQFGQTALRTEPVRIAAAAGGAGIMGALGLQRGSVNGSDSTKLVAQTSLRAGDEFTLKVDGKTAKKIVVTADDTLTTLADRIRKATGIDITVTTPKVGDKSVLRIDAKPGHAIELIAGADGRDALAKLGIEPQRLSAAPVVPKDAPRVRPGGTFGLGLSDAYSLATAESAALALKTIESAISMTQTAFRSLYWDDGKAALANGGSNFSGGPSAYQQKQLAMYQDALSRLGGSNPYF